MSYSNINRDKVQQEPFMAVKTTLLKIFLIVVTGASFVNIYNQWKLLNQAILRNWETTNEIKRLELENKVLIRQIEYATSSAFIRRKAREYLSLGGENDSFLVLPETNNTELKAEINETTDVPIIIAWWNLFTHQR